MVIYSDGIIINNNSERRKNMDLGALLTVLASGLIVPAMPYFLSFAAGAMIYVVVEELIPEMSRASIQIRALLCSRSALP